jgi:hypothetical protein
MWNVGDKVYHPRVGQCIIASLYRKKYHSNKDQVYFQIDEYSKYCAEVIPMDDLAARWEVMVCDLKKVEELNGKSN